MTPKPEVVTTRFMPVSLEAFKIRSIHTLHYSLFAIIAKFRGYAGKWNLIFTKNRFFEMTNAPGVFR